MSNVPKALQARRFGLAVLLALSSAFVAHGQRSGAAATPKKAAAAIAAPSASWKEIDRLISEQKFEEAAAAIARLRRAARERGDETESTRALIRETQLRTGLHGYETAVRFLRDEAWPKGLLSRAALELYYAQALVTYFHAYSWEIQKRERVETSGAADLKAWTGEQIYGEAVKAYARVWRDREALGRQSVKALADFLEPNDYPSGVRGTLRDAVAYLFVSLLADTGGWTPAQSNEVFRLDLAALLASGGQARRSVRLEDDAVHPLIRIVAVLDDLEAWHASRGEREAALEARLERLRRLFSAFTEDEDRARIEADLEQRLPGFAAVAWSAMGKAQLAEFVERPDLSGDLPRARAIAEQGARAWPASVGGKRCLAIVKSIEAPDYLVQIMKSDGPGKRSILVLHKNVRRLTFRAYRLDLAERVRTARNVFAILPTGDETEKLARSGAPAEEWSVALPATPDYRSHATYVTPPMKEAGLYAVAASGAETFGGPGFPLVAANFIVSNIVLVTRPVAGAGGGPGGLEVQTLLGDSGSPAPGVEATLWRMVWNPERVERVQSVTTDSHGLARFLPAEDRAGLLFVFARAEKDLAFEPGVSMGSGPSPAVTTTSSLLFTDRSIYRPLQKILWKVIGYTGNAVAGRFQALPGSPVTVTLLDANNQVIDSRLAATNEFGSAAGEFAIPAGRSLGTWRVRSSLGGAEAAIRVEEYKRPTFAVTWKDPSEPLRLNRPARVRGEARYLFGLPVASGSVRWRVTRTPQYFWWASVRGTGDRAAGAQIVASGVSPLKPDGTFEVAFTPAADERLGRSSKDLTYSYALDAEASDEGGETRSASRSFRLGFVSVEARLVDPPGFLRESLPGRFRVSRTDLDGTPRAGRGSWRVVSLERPARTSLPADQPPSDDRRVVVALGRGFPGASSRFPAGDPFRTPGDALRPRWDTAYDPAAMMRLWKDSKEILRGEVAHDARGEAQVEIGGLPAGPYRLYYSTVDDFGAVFEMPQDFLVAGPETPLALPAVLAVENGTVAVGGTARFLVTTGLPDQTLYFDVYKAGRRVERRDVFDRSRALIEIPVAEADRGGFSVKLSALRDHQWMTLTLSVFVPWDDKQLKVSFATFRDTLRPGARETWKIKVEAPKSSGAPALAAAELLAYMYDRSLDAFARHSPPDPLALYPNRTGVDWSQPNLGEAPFQYLRERFPTLPDYPRLRPDGLKFFNGYAIGGPGRRGVLGGVPGVAGDMVLRNASAASALAPQALVAKEAAAAAPAPAAEIALRSEFAETAFWQPHLLTGADGSADIEFTVPDSVTSWNVFVHAVTRDWKAGALVKEAKSVKELMVRPYVPRFLREGDRADLKIVVNNASEKPMAGRVAIDILDAETNASALPAFGVPAEKASLPFAVEAGRGTTVTLSLSAPKGVGLYAFKVTAAAGDVSDGELRPVPLLPGRVHLLQSRFVALHDRDRREMTFPDLAKNDDTTLVNEQMVVTVDAQLFDAVLQALPYLVNYPYECTEQTLNRFVSTGIVSSLFHDYPSIAKMAGEMAKRDERLETWDTADPNRKMALEETPWLEAAKGGRDTGHPLSRVLDPRVAKAERESALAKLAKAQTESGGFPWWAGGPPSEYMTVYILHGFANALEFGVDVPRDMVLRAWTYAGTAVRRDLAECMRGPGPCPLATFVNYTLSSYPDESWYGRAFDAAYRRTLLEHSFAHWKEHSPMLKGQLALTLKRMGRAADAKLVWDSVMDSAKTDRDTGTSWAPENRSWLWYNDTIETQAFALRAENELAPSDPRRAGLVQWLFLNKKMNQWKSTRATAEVIASIAQYLKKEGALGTREDATVTAGSVKTTFVFEPESYTGRKNQVVIPGDRLDPKTASTVVVEKGSRGLVFASATWHFSTEKLPAEDRGDFFTVSRKFFKREASAAGFVVKPLAEGAQLAPGDQVEIQLSLSSKHEAEYVHLRDPRAAGLEPENAVSGHHWDLGVAWYEETRDSGTNFFFERLPAGQYTFKYRVRAAMAGTFRVGPAIVHSMYAPEFVAYSAGAAITIR